MVWHTQEGIRIEKLYKHVLAQALHDAFFLKRKYSARTIHAQKKHNTHIVWKNDAVTWLRGEQDVEGLKLVCDLADMPVERLVRKCRQWFSGEHSGGYEFKDVNEFKKVMGFDFSIIEEGMRLKYDKTYRERAR